MFAGMPSTPPPVGPQGLTPADSLTPDSAASSSSVGSRSGASGSVDGSPASSSTEGLEAGASASPSAAASGVNKRKLSGLGRKLRTALADFLR